MSIRTKEGAVRDLLKPGGDYDTVNNPNLVPFMLTASRVVDRVVTCAAAKGVTFDAEEKELMERWLSAYYYTRSDAIYQSKSTAGASAGFVLNPDRPDRYLTGALDIDVSGCLSAILKGARAGAAWLGKPRSQQVPYDQRD